MDDNDSDIDSQMIFHSDMIVNNDSFLNKLSTRGKQFGKHPIFEFINKRNESLSYSIFMLVIYSIKFVSTVIIVSVWPTNCETHVDLWLGIMCFHDFALLVARSLLLSCIITKINKEAITDNQSDVCSEILSCRDNLKELQIRLDTSMAESQRKKNLLNSYNKRKKAGNTLLSCTLVLFLGLFVWGQYIYYGPFPSCGVMPILKKIIFLINVFFGYFYIALPLIFLLFGCISLGWLHVGSKCLQKLSIGSKGKGKVIPESMSTSASRERFSTNSGARSDCAICFSEFKNGEEVLKLDCDQSHVFHENCLGIWMDARKTKACPICEKKKEAILVLFE